jgi:hypothetical protein
VLQLLNAEAECGGLPREVQYILARLLNERVEAHKILGTLRTVCNTPLAACMLHIGYSS